MNKDPFKALAFTVLWAAYCLVVILPTPRNHNWGAVAGLVLGSVFMWLTGWLLLALTRRRGLSRQALAMIGIALVAADLLAKALVKAHLAGGRILSIIPGWLDIRFAPNHSNNVILNLLGIVIDSGLFHAATKFITFAAAGALVLVYCRRQGYSLADPRFRLGAALMVAGAASSILESGFRGYVLDFISLAGIVSFDTKDLCLMYGVGLFALAALDWESPGAQREKAQKPG